MEGLTLHPGKLCVMEEDRRGAVIPARCVAAGHQVALLAGRGAVGRPRDVEGHGRL